MTLSSMTKILVILLVTILGLGLQYCSVRANPVEDVKQNVNKPKGKEVPSTFDYVSFLKLRNKSYNPIELMSRAKLFMARTVNIFKHNLDYVAKKVSYRLSQNEFTDLSASEINEKFVVRDQEFGKSVASEDLYDAPADEVYRRLKNGGQQLTLSKSGVFDDDANAREKEKEEKRATSELNFLNDDVSNIDVEALVAKLSESGVSLGRRAEKVSKFAARATSEDIAEEARNRKGISSRPSVEGGNKNFDPSLLPSKASYIERVVDFQMDPKDFQLIETYLSMKPEEGRVSLSDMFEMIDNYFPGDEYSNMIGKDDQGGNKVEPGTVDDPMDVDEDGSVSNGPVKYDIDWRQTGCVSRVKAQQECNSCYAFAVMDLIEFHYCRQKEDYVEFSVQHVVDCGSKAELRGCQGGRISNVALFVQKFGLITNSHYPYRGNEQQCPFNEQHDKQGLSYKLKPRLRWGTFHTIADWYKWLPRGPVVVGINMPGNFFAYAGGVHDGLDCVVGKAHAMLLVGSGVENGKRFWLLKNSFSYFWGEGGYFRLSMRAPMRCFCSAAVGKPDFV